MEIHRQIKKSRLGSKLDTRLFQLHISNFRHVKSCILFSSFYHPSGRLCIMHEYMHWIFITICAYTLHSDCFHIHHSPCNLRHRQWRLADHKSRRAGENYPDGYVIAVTFVAVSGASKTSRRAALDGLEDTVDNVIRHLINDAFRCPFSLNIGHSSNTASYRAHFVGTQAVARWCNVQCSRQLAVDAFRPVPGGWTPRCRRPGEHQSHRRRRRRRCHSTLYARLRRRQVVGAGQFRSRFRIRSSRDAGERYELRAWWEIGPPRLRSVSREVATTVFGARKYDQRQRRQFTASGSDLHGSRRRWKTARWRQRVVCLNVSERVDLERCYE